MLELAVRRRSVALLTKQTCCALCIVSRLMPCLLPSMRALIYSFVVPDAVGRSCFEASLPAIPDMLFSGIHQDATERPSRIQSRLTMFNLLILPCANRLLLLALYAAFYGQLDGSKNCLIFKILFSCSAAVVTKHRSDTVWVFSP
jgi:hypothetical protein